MCAKKNAANKDGPVFKEKTEDTVTIPMKVYCIFCGSTIVQISDRTEGIVNAVYDCPKCSMNYCDQCSCEEIIDGNTVQRCLRCYSRLDIII